MLPDRQQGVRLPEGQGAARGEPKTVAHVVPVEWVAVQWFDEHGRGHEEVVCRVGAVVYLAPNGEQWSANLKRAASWITERVIRDMDARKASIPDTDTVSVIDNAKDTEASK